MLKLVTMAASGSDVPEWRYGSNAGEVDAYAEDDEFAAQLEACLLHSPAEAAELPVVALGEYYTTARMGEWEPCDDLEGSLIHIFQHPSAAESGVVDDIFADIVQSSDDHVDEVGVLDLSPELIGIDQWTMATNVTESPHRSGSSRERNNYSEADLTRSTTLNLKAGATVTAFGDRWGSFGGSSSSADDEIRWLEVEDDEEPHEYEWHNNNYSFTAAMISAMSPDNEENRSATSDASCSGECSTSSSIQEALLDREEVMVDDRLPEVHHEQQRRAPCDVDAPVQQCPSENAAPQQCGSTSIMREEVAVVLAPKKYRGVVYNINTSKWEAHVWDANKVQKQDAASRGTKRVKAGVQIYLGQYHTGEEAAAVHDMAAIKMGLAHDTKFTNLGSCSRPSYSLNFPVEAYDGEVVEHQDWSVRDYLWKLRKGGVGFSRGSSALKGVSWKKKLNRFDARYSSKDGGVKREFYLGLFEDEEMAGRHYDLALLFFKGEDAITNFRPSLYSDVEVAEYGRHLLERTN